MWLVRKMPERGWVCQLCAQALEGLVLWSLHKPWMCACKLSKELRLVEDAIRAAWVERAMIVSTAPLLQVGASDSAGKHGVCGSFAVSSRALGQVRLGMRPGQVRALMFSLLNPTTLHTMSGAICHMSGPFRPAQHARGAGAVHERQRGAGANGGRGDRCGCIILMGFSGRRGVTICS